MNFVDNVAAWCTTSPALLYPGPPPGHARDGDDRRSERGV